MAEWTDAEWARFEKQEAAQSLQTEKDEKRLAARRKYNFACYTRKRLRGECAGCQRPALYGYTRCHIHAEQHAVRDSAYVRHRLAEPGHDYHFKNNLATAKRYYKNKGAGLCSHCGHVPPVPGYIWCQLCKDLGNKNASARYANRRSKGLCSACDCTALEGLTRCSYHLECHRLREKVRREKRKGLQNAKKV